MWGDGARAGLKWSCLFSCLYIGVYVLGQRVSFSAILVENSEVQKALICESFIENIGGWFGRLRD